MNESLDSKIPPTRMIVYGQYKKQRAELTVRNVLGLWMAKLWVEAKPGNYPRTYRLTEDGWKHNSEKNSVLYESSGDAIDAAINYWEMLLEINSIDTSTYQYGHRIVKKHEP